MNDFDDLEELFNDLGSDKPNKDQLDKMFEIYSNELLDDYIEIDGLRLVFNSHKSWLKGFEGFPETFVHLITKEESYGKPRKFDKERANRIHWIKPILLNKNRASILYFEKKDKDGYVKKHYWYKEKKFVVILKPILPKILLVTAFFVGKTKEMNFEYDYKKV